MTVRHQRQRRPPKSDGHEIRLHGLGVDVLLFRFAGGRWVARLSRTKNGNFQIAQRGWWKSRKAAISGAARYARAEAAR